MPTNPPNITALPSPPDPNDRSTFNARAYPWSVAQQTLATEVAAVAANVKGNADEAVAAAGTATYQASIATTQASLASAFAASAVNSPGTSSTSATPLMVGVGEKSFVTQAGKNYLPGQVVNLARTGAATLYRMSGPIGSYNASSGAMTIQATSVTGSGAGPFGDWTISLGGEPGERRSMPMIVRHSDTMIVTGDLGSLVQMRGTFTQTLDTPANLGAGWYAILQANPENELLPATATSALLGSDVAVNGGFSSDANWTKGAGWSIGGGLANASGTTAALAAMIAPLTGSQTYAISYTATRSAGDFVAVAGTLAGPARSEGGLFTDTITANGAAMAVTGRTAFTGSIDSVTIRPYGQMAIPPLVSGKSYRFSFTVSDWVAGSIAPKFGSQTLTAYSGFGSYEVEFVATGSHTTFEFVFAGFSGSLGDSISLVETGDITITLDGTTFKMYPRETRLVQCDGVVLRSVVLNSFYKRLNASTNFTKPPGYRTIEGMLWGGGAGGCVSVNVVSEYYYYTSRGGGGGQGVPFSIPVESLPASVSVAIGAGGLFSTVDGDQAAGGESRFGQIVAKGGNGYFGGGDPASGFASYARGYGFATQGGSAPGNSGYATAGLDADWAGGAGAYGRGFNSNVSTGASGGASRYGGGGGATSGSSSSPGVGGRSVFAGRGGLVGAPAGAAPAGGGYGGAGGHGARGAARLWGAF